MSNQVNSSASTFKARAVNGDFWSIDNGDGNPVDIVYKTIQHAMADCIVFVRDAREAGLHYSLYDLEIVEFGAEGNDLRAIPSSEFPILQHMERIGVSEEGKDLVWNGVIKDVQEV